MKEKLRAAILNLDVDYADIRFDEEQKTQIALNGDRLEQIATFSPVGGHVRAYVKGGKAIASFSRLEDAAAVARQTAAAARVAADYRSQPIRLADAPVIEDDFPVSSDADPRDMSLAQKFELLEYYNGLAMKVSEVLMTQFVYGDSYARRSYVNTEGTAVGYEHVISHMLGVIVGRRRDAIRRAYFAVGGSSDFRRLVDREEMMEHVLRELDELLDASPVKAGVYPIVLDPYGASVFIHEAFGHRSEADLTRDNPMLRERLALGNEIATPILNVSDDPTIPDRGGSYSIDDEGVRAKKTHLIVDGCVAGRLHSRESAASFDEPVTGNCRASDAGYGPLIRMSNTVIEPGDHSLDDMISSIDDGLYVAGGAGGQGGIDFTFGSRWARRIRNGKLAEMVADANLSGNLFTTLKAISMVGNDQLLLEYFDCGKGSVDGIQLMNRIGAGAPHIKIDAATVGGVS